ncbi:MAG: hypothetical protein JXR72_05605 [Proteobacteria bacterium]|nr:hypothetical protein [Pseudomonadota bacterium]
MKTNIWGLKTILFVLVLMVSGCATTGDGPSSFTEAPRTVESFKEPYFGPKKRIAVLEFDNRVNRSWWDASWRVEENLTEMVITELMETGRFIVVERSALNEILSEQDLAESGRVRQETAAKIGELLGAQVLLKGTVTEFIEKESGGAAGIMLGGIGIGGTTSEGYVAMDLRLIDATTGQVLESHRAEGKIKSTGIGGIAFFKGIAFGGTTFNKTALGKATRAAVTDAVGFTVSNMEEQAWQGRVVKVEGASVYINAGSNMNISEDMVLSVFSRGEELIDPDTGLSLGTTISRSGTIRIVQVAEKFSIARIMEGAGFQRGDIVKMQ